MMVNSEQTGAARDQLNRTLGFFARVDGKASVVLGVDTAMLAVLATRTSSYALLRWEWIAVGLTLVPLAFSFWQLYREAFPSLDGGEQSLLYFREIAKRDERKYIEAWQRMTDDEYLKDLLRQTWRNSEILKQKFDHMKLAFYGLALAIVPWMISLALLSRLTTN
jgi:hypothetical protein